MKRMVIDATHSHIPVSSATSTWTDAIPQLIYSIPMRTSRNSFRSKVLSLQNKTYILDYCAYWNLKTKFSHICRAQHFYRIIHANRSNPTVDIRHSLHSHTKKLGRLCYPSCKYWPSFRRTGDRGGGCNPVFRSSVPHYKNSLFCFCSLDARAPRTVHLPRDYIFMSCRISRPSLALPMNDFELVILTSFRVRPERLLLTLYMTVNFDSVFCKPINSN